MKTRILEIGVGGTKRYPLRFRVPYNPDVEYYFCDKDSVFHPSVSVIPCDVEGHLSYPSSFFDSVYISHVLEHLLDPERALREIYRVLKKSGKVHIFVPNFLSRNTYIDPSHRWCFSVFSLARLLRRTNFVVSTSFNIVAPTLLHYLIKMLFLIFSNELYLVGVKR